MGIGKAAIVAVLQQEGILSMEFIKSFELHHLSDEELLSRYSEVFNAIAIRHHAIVELENALATICFALLQRGRGL